MLKKILTAAVVLGMATGAQASNFEVSGYVQGNLGQATAKKPGMAKDIRNYHKGRGGSSSSSRNDLGYKMIVGLQLNQYMAVEAQYIDLGKLSYKGRSWGEYDKLDLKNRGFGFNVVGSYPVTEDFSVFAKTGFHYLKTKAKHKYIEDGLYSYGSNKSIRKWSNSIGVGVSYRVIPNLSIVGEYERYRNVANKKVDFEDWIAEGKLKHNIDYLSVGVRYSF